MKKASKKRSLPETRGLHLILFACLLLGAPSIALAQDAPQPAASTPNGPFYVKKVIVCEYRIWYIRNDSTIYGYNNGSRHPVPFPIGGRKAVTAAGGFNVFRVIDDQGYLWTSKIDYTTNTVRTNVDTAEGNPFDGNVFVDAYANCTATIRKDGSIWYFGNDSLPPSSKRPTTRSCAPTRISPPG